MKKINISIPKRLVVPLGICSIVLAIWIVSIITNSNSAYVDFIFQKVDSVGSDGGDIPAINKLNELVEENFLDWTYYEVCSIEGRSGHQWYANYNKKHRALLISGDPLSGWSYFFYATPAELKMISDRKIPSHKFHLFLKPFPEHLLGEIPTRSRDLSSIF